MCQINVRYMCRIDTYTKRTPHTHIHVYKSNKRIRTRTHANIYTRMYTCMHASPSRIMRLCERVKNA